MSGSVTKSFAFHLERDQDILEFLEQQDARGQSRLVRRALRLLMHQDAQGGLSYTEAVDACREAIRAELVNGVIHVEGCGASATPKQTPEEMSEAARNLATFEDELEEW